LAGDSVSLLLPVELRRVNHTASTNGVILRCPGFRKPYNEASMSNQTQIDQIAERVERLLVRHAELQRTNALLSSQVDALTHERDSLKSRLNAARARVDALLERLPEATSSSRTAP
jgi:chromosome segregation ATPase